MTALDTPLNLTEALLAGPRGQSSPPRIRADRRRACARRPHAGLLLLRRLHAAYQLDVGSGTSHVIYGPGADQPLPNIPPEEVARRLTNVPLPAATEKDLRTVLAATTDSARYWHEPGGEDVLAATEPMRRQLRRIAEHITASVHARWWTTGVALADQWSPGWAEHNSVHPVGQARAASRRQVVAEEERAARERPANPTAGYSGQVVVGAARRSVLHADTRRRFARVPMVRRGLRG